MKEDRHKWKDVQCKRIGRLNIVKLTLTKVIYRFNGISNISDNFFFIDFRE